jgi:Uma2 family endonuclease
MSAPALHRFNVEEYYRMAETGVLKPDARVELIDGEIHDMSPIGPLHGGVVNRLTRFFGKAARGRWLLSPQNPTRLNMYSEPQPDLMLLKPAPDDYTTHHPAPDDVLLLIEVSQSSLAFDRRKKIPLYARTGISEVWIVNLRKRVIEIYRDPHAAGYAETTIVRAGDKVSPQAFPKVSLDIAELFK